MVSPGGPGVQRGRAALCEGRIHSRKSSAHYRPHAASPPERWKAGRRILEVCSARRGSTDASDLKTQNTLVIGAENSRVVIFFKPQILETYLLLHILLDWFHYYSSAVGDKHRSHKYLTGNHALCTLDCGNNGMSKLYTLSPNTSADTSSPQLAS